MSCKLLPTECCHQITFSMLRLCVDDKLMLRYIKSFVDSARDLGQAAEKDHLYQTLVGEGGMTPDRFEAAFGRLTANGDITPGSDVGDGGSIDISLEVESDAGGE